MYVGETAARWMEWVVLLRGAVLSPWLSDSVGSLYTSF